MRFAIFRDDSEKQTTIGQIQFLPKNKIRMAELVNLGSSRKARLKAFRRRELVEKDLVSMKIPK